MLVCQPPVTTGCGAGAFLLSTAQIPTPVFAMEAAAATKKSPGVRWQAKRDTALFAADNERSEAADGSRSSHAKTPRPKDTRVQPWGLWVLA